MRFSQTAFSAALLDPDMATPVGLIDPKGRPAGKRFDVYRNNVVVSLMDAMETAFPVIRKMLGANFFRRMVRLFVRENPPDSPLLMFYGASFPTFLEQFEPVAKYPYLGDVARLELVRRIAYHAKDCGSVGADELSAIAPEKLMGAVIRLAPSMQIISSAYPIVDLWEFNSIEGAAKPAPAAQTALVTRPALNLEMQVIDRGTRLFLQALNQSNCLSNAFDLALVENPEFDLSNALGLLLQCQLIAEIEL